MTKSINSTVAIPMEIACPPALDQHKWGALQFDNIVNVPSQAADALTALRAEHDRAAPVTTTGSRG